LIMKSARHVAFAARDDTTLFERNGMSNRPAAFTEADVRRTIRAAKKEGAPKVEVRRGDTSVIVHLCEPDQKPVEADEEISL